MIHVYFVWIVFFSKYIIEDGEWSCLRFNPSSHMYHIILLSLGEEVVGILFEQLKLIKEMKVKDFSLSLFG